VIGSVARLATLHTGALAAENVELAVFFAVGLFGGAHCLGMCGPLVTTYADRLQRSSAGGREGVLTFYEVRQHGLFNLGRTLSYATIGGVLGLVGGILFDASALVAGIGTAVRGVTGVVVGVAILAVGLQYVLGRQGGHSVLGGGMLSRVYGRLTAHIDDRVTGPGIVGLGLVHGLLPCPILYPAFLYAFAGGDPIRGALALGVLGLGTFPTLFLYGTIIQSVSATHRERLHRVLGVAFLVMGWMPLAHALGLFGVAVPHVEVPFYQPLAVALPR